MIYGMLLSIRTGGLISLLKKIISIRKGSNMLRNKLDVEVKDVKKQIQGIKNNLESIVDIVKVSYKSS